jgi:hypothetical protein
VKKSLLEIYALSVCFVSTFVALVACIVLLNQAAKLVLPDVMMNDFTYKSLISNDAFWENRRGQIVGPKGEPPGEAARPDEASLTRQRLRALEEARAEQAHGAVQGMIRWGAALLIAAICFAMHWVMARRPRERASD